MNLKSDKRLNIQLRLDFPSAPTGEARLTVDQLRDYLKQHWPARRHRIALGGPERPTDTNRIMEEVCERANLKEALRQVRATKVARGSTG